jgi:selenide,water dikinase
VRRLVAEGVAPGGSRANMRHLAERTEAGPGVGEEDLLILSDAQTSGGLLVALPAEQAEAFAERCRARGAARAAVVGAVRPRGAKRLAVVEG